MNQLEKLFEILEDEAKVEGSLSSSKVKINIQKEEASRKLHLSPNILSFVLINLKYLNHLKKYLAIFLLEKLKYTDFSLTTLNHLEREEDSEIQKDKSLDYLGLKEEKFILDL